MLYLYYVDQYHMWENIGWYFNLNKHTSMIIEYAWNIDLIFTILDQYKSHVQFIIYYHEL